MTGVVRENEALLRLTVHGTRRRKHQIEAVIDTGFSGYLTLPPDVIAGLGLAWQSTAQGILADGSASPFELYEAAVVWDRRARLIVVCESDATPLVGMAMLDGYELNVQVRPRGKVTITRLEDRAPPRRRA
jgi:clan AA aspartic protease